MAEIEPTSAIDLIHGKLKGADPGYFYVRNGKQFRGDNLSPGRKRTIRNFRIVGTLCIMGRMCKICTY